MERALFCASDFDRVGGTNGGLLRLGTSLLPEAEKEGHRPLGDIARFGIQVAEGFVALLDGSTAL